YGLSTLSFVGGSLVPIGGHNILEPLAWGKPVLFGPFMNNFRDIAELAKREGIGIEVKGERELAEKIKLLLSLPSWRKEIGEKAEALIERMKGAGERYSDYILQLLKTDEN
ncbi:MAG: 3-deoxy-D-manno-octulosonic acid transferase, partial [bacterium]